jgi:hypothetical protein
MKEVVTVLGKQMGRIVLEYDFSYVTMCIWVWSAACRSWSNEPCFEAYLCSCA